MSFDDLYNNFKIVEQEVKGTTNSSSSSNSEKMAFVSSPSSINEVNTAYEVSIANTQAKPASTQVTFTSTQVSTTNLSDATVPKTSKNVSEDIPNEVKESPATLLVKDRVSDNKDYSVESPTVAKKKTVVPTIAKVEFVRSKQQEQPVRKTVRPWQVNTARPRLVNTARPNTVVVNAVRVNQVTTKVKTINGEEHIQALVDKNKVITTETSVRSDLHLEDAEGRNDQDMFDTSILDVEEVVAKKEISAADPVTIAGEEVTTAALIDMKTSKPKSKGSVIQDPSETPTPTPIDSSQQSSKSKMIGPEKPLKRKDPIMIDKEWIEAFVPMDIELVKGSKKAIQGNEKAQEGSSKRTADKLEQEDAKRQRIEKENESTKLKRCLEIIPEDDDNVTITGTPLSSKSPTIVDYKIYKEGRKSFFKMSEQMETYLMAMQKAYYCGYFYYRDLGGIGGSRGDQVNLHHDSPLLRGHTFDRAEGSLNLEAVYSLCTNLSNRVLALETVKDAQAKEILTLKGRIKKLEKRCKPSISHHRAWLRSVSLFSKKKKLSKKKSISKQGRKNGKSGPTKDGNDKLDAKLDEDMEYMDTEEAVNEQELSTVGPTTTPTTTTIFDDEEITLADTLIKIKDDKAKGVAFKDSESTDRPARSILTLKPLPTIDPKDKRKGVLEEPESAKKRKEGSRMKRMSKRQKTDVDLEDEEKLIFFLKIDPDEEGVIDYKIDESGGHDRGEKDLYVLVLSPHNKWSSVHHSKELASPKQTDLESHKEGSSSYINEVIHSFYANQAIAPQLDYDDLEQINDDDIEDIDLKWQVAMISLMINKFHKRKRRKFQFDTKYLVGIDKTKVECFNCHKMEHFARDYRAKGNQDNRRIDDGYNGNKTRDNGRIPAYQDDSKVLVTINGEDIDWSGHIEESVFINKASDLEDTPVNDRFVDGLHATSADESNSKSSECASCESDSSVETSTSMPELVENASKVVYEPKVWTDAPIIEEENIKETGTTNHSPKIEKHDRNGHTRKGLGYYFTRKACFVCGSFSYLIRDCDFHEKGMAKQAELTKIKNKSFKDKGIVNSRCSRHMTGNKAHLADYQEFKGGSISFGGSNGRITGKGKIKIGRLDFEDVYYVEELKHYNLLSVSQICDKKNKDETAPILKDFIRQAENQFSYKVKTIRSDNGIELKNKELIEFCRLKVIKRKYTNVRTPQQNGVAERKNMTLIKAARTMLADSFLATTFKAEAVNTACYVLNRVLVTKP
uniref:Ribonuclease H-like domain-containing protein n=1 Tax=Tanacetum cinerariifolium TaxID=118510 RepID=A0A6L2LTC4_TANCI|nr:ribonuclease H-like domain-containing protein [Tanacetum cinerariifolium]